MNKKIILLLLAALAPAARADILHLNKGEELNGRITGMDAVSVTIEVDGKPQVIDRKDIMKIQFVGEYKGRMSAPASDPVIKSLLAAPPKPEAYPNDGYIHFYDDDAITVSPDGGCTETERMVNYVLRERGKSPSSFVSTGYLPGVSTMTISHAYEFGGGKASYLDDISVMDGDTYLVYPAYAGHHTMKFAIPNAQIGSALDYETVFTEQYRSTAPFFGESYFRFSEPTGKSSFTVRVPQSLKLAYKEVNMPDARRFAVSREGHDNVYTWELDNQPSYRREPQTPPYGLYAPRVMVSVSDTWEHVRDTFAPLLKERLTLTPEIKAKTAELVAGKKTDTEKLEAVYNWLAKEIKMQYVPMDNYSFVPKPVGETFANRAGNYLDKPFLLYAMLEEAGLKPEFAYAQGKNAVFAAELPNIRQFSIGEVLASADGKNYVLAPLDDTHRYFELPSWLQAGSALRVLGDAQKPLLFINPEFAPEKEATVETAQYTLDKKGNVEGAISTVMTGDEQAGMRGYKDYKKADLDKSMQEYAHWLHPQARLESYTLTNLQDLSKDIGYSMNVGIKDYAMKAGDYMILRLPGMPGSASDVSETERDLPFFWYGASASSKTVTLKLPSGYKAYYLPKDITLEHGGIKYSASYKAQDDSIVFAENYTRTAILLPAADYQNYKSFREAQTAFSENWIVLKKN